jgi:hypothetical protein
MKLFGFDRSTAGGHKHKMLKPRFLFIALSLVALAGCDDPSVDEHLYAGTQLAVDACIKRNISSVVSEAEIKEQCIKKH